MSNKTDISKIDENFILDMNLPEDVHMYNVFESPIEINGLYLEDGKKEFKRLPDEFKDSDEVNERIKILMHHTSGGRIRFATDSPYVAIVVKLAAAVNMNISSSDLFTCKRGCKNFTFKKAFLPDVVNNKDVYGGFEHIFRHDDYEEHEVLINLPLYNGIKSIEIGIKEGCKLYAPTPYKVEKPVYVYGSSITQGGSASRPGNTYMAHLSRWLDFDFVNLGFSGGAKGEQKLAEYIAKKDMSVFILDYDANADTAEYLEETHYDFYKTIREKHKDLPIIMMSFPRFPKLKVKTPGNKDQIKSNMVIVDTFKRAYDEGDRNVYYIDGATLFGTEDQDFCTADGCHPNDHGFYMMAKAVKPVLREIIKNMDI